MKKQITLTNGKKVKIDSKLTGLVLFQLQNEGVITKDFLTSLLSADGIQNIDIFDSMRTIYAAYRQANPVNYMDFDSFMKVYELDVVEALNIFTSIMRKKEKQQNNMANGFRRKTHGKKA